ncbi:MAG: hypothetical protein PHY02_09780 [Phycisphaerae bacterium]|nr:hypothetical protein [Phycisphaerae bacterium]
MATNTVSNVGNIFDVLKFKLPNGSVIDSVVNTLVETDDFSKFMPSFPANGGLTHHGLRTVSLPTGYLVDVGGSWKTSKSQREPFVEGLCTIKSTYQAPKDTFTTDSEEAGKALLKAEKDGHVVMMNQTVGNLILAGSTTPNQSGLVGLMERAPYNAIDEKFTFDVGGTGSNLRSCWLVKPGIDTVHALHNPFHPTLGIEQDDKGEVMVDGLGTNGDEHRWDIMIEFAITKGICVRDMTAMKRIANAACGVDDVVDATLINKIVEASIINAPKGLTNRQWLLFCDERLYAKLVIAAMDKLFVYTSDKNIYHTALPMIGPDIVVCRWDALNCAIGSGETIVT